MRLTIEAEATTNWVEITTAQALAQLKNIDFILSEAHPAATSKFGLRYQLHTAIAA